MSTRETVFVVDDDPSMLKSIARLLRQLGYGTMLFNSATALRRDGKLDQACCIVLDINLGDESGIELRRWLATSGAAQLPVIFVTGNDNPAELKSAIQSGCVACLSKPFSAETMSAAAQAASALSATQHSDKSER